MTTDIKFDDMRICDLDAERALIGSMMLDNDSIDLVASTVSQADFYRGSHHVLFQAILDVHEKGAVADPVTVHELLERRNLINQLDEDLTTEYISEIFHDLPTAANAEYYARIVKDRSVRRQLHQRGCEIVRNAPDLGLEIHEMVEEAHNKILDISATTAPRHVATLAEALGDALESIDRKQARGGGIKTGFDEFDELTGGLHRGELTIIAARPSVGKTALGLNIATRVSFNREMRVLFVSLEQSRDAIGNRILSSESDVDMHKLRNLRLAAEDIRALLDAKAAVSRHKLFIDDIPSQTVTQIGATCRRTKQRHGLDLVVVDYLQLIESEPYDTRIVREQQVAKMTRKLKGFAKQLDISLIVLAQLNRESEKNNAPPKLHHLRESGAIEQDADVVMLLHRPEANDEVVVDVAKQRDGMTGEFKLAFIKRFMRFENVASPFPDLR